MTNKKQILSIDIARYKHKEIGLVEDFVAIEEPLQININNKPVSITMRTPGDDLALSLGFLFTEGIITDYAEVSIMRQLEDNVVNVELSEQTFQDLKSLERNFYTTSSCGVCGKTSIDSITVMSKFKMAALDHKINASIFQHLIDKLINVQSTFEVTGGIHAAALYHQDGRFLYHSEDVGRHNALDKLIGHTLMAGRLPLKEHILLLSGRASFELIQKATMAGIPVIAAVGAPSSLAVDLAKKNNLTLIGFLKKTGYNIYCGKENIIV